MPSAPAPDEKTTEEHQLMDTNSTIYFMAMQAEQEVMNRRAERGWLAAQAAIQQEHSYRIERISQTVHHWFARLAWKGQVNPARDHAPGRAL